MVVPFFEGYPDCLSPDRVGVELDAAIHPLLVHALDLVVEARKRLNDSWKVRKYSSIGAARSSHRSPGSTTPIPGG
jgi:hypothetical protein